MDEKTILRVRDFWTALALICVSCFFLYKTSEIPFLNVQTAGVDAAGWYNSAALVPYGIFVCMLLLALILLVIAIRDGGAKHALSAMGIGYSKPEISRMLCISLILFFYIFGLVPRVDFILSSAIMMTALIWGFHSGNQKAMFISTVAIGVVALYAMIAHFPRSEWDKPIDDDWLTLVMFAVLTLIMFVSEARKGGVSIVTKATPIISIIVPLILVMAMAFGFRQNVPNRTGIVFSQIEYHYYVTLRPLWKAE